MASSDEGCPIVTRVEGFCNLNATLSCSENFKLSLKGCFPIAASVMVLVIIAMMFIICVCCVCVWKKKRRRVNKTIQGNTDNEPLLKPTNRELVDCSMSASNDEKGIFNQAKDKIERTDYKEKTATSNPPLCELKSNKKKSSRDPSKTAETDSYNHAQNNNIKAIEQKAGENVISSPAQDIEAKKQETLSTSNSHKSIGETFPNIEEEKRSTERTSEMCSERDHVEKLPKKMFKYKFKKPLPDLGSRLQKYWYQVNTKVVKGMLIIVKSSRQCRLNLQEMKQLELLKSVFEHLKHPSLHRVHDVAYKDGYVGILQDFMPKGSIRDYLHQAEPHKDWADKYSPTGDARSLPIAVVANCARDILTAMKVLYDIGFEYIGQIQSGNVFLIDDSHCVLGGFENTLLGFRTSCFADLQEQNLLEKMDVVMFGHLIYEMCCGRSLLHQHQMILSSQDMNIIEDIEARNFVKFVFECAKKKGKTSKDLIAEISKHKFLEVAEETTLAAQPMLTFDMHNFISEIFTNHFSLDTIMLKLEDKYYIEEELPRLGWRNGKVWLKVKNRRLSKEGILTAVAVPDSCPVYVSSSMDAIRRLLREKHSHVVSIGDVDYINVDGLHVIVIFQDWKEDGSIKDIIHKCQPLLAWDKKYHKGTRLQLPDVKYFGAQILQAMIYWSGLLGDGEPLTLGHIHTGNIFISGNICRVGGFENTLLGFKTRKFGLFEDYQDKLDAVMFGHVIYEMSTGMELETAVPTEKDLKAVPRELHQVFHYIFHNASVELQKILDLFRSSQPNPSVPLILEPDVKYLLKKVRKGKPRNQDDKGGKIKDDVNRKLKLLKPK